MYRTSRDFFTLASTILGDAAYQAAGCAKTRYYQMRSDPAFCATAAPITWLDRITRLTAALVDSGEADAVRQLIDYIAHTSGLPVEVKAVAASPTGPLHVEALEAVAAVGEVSGVIAAAISDGELTDDEGWLALGKIEAAETQLAEVKAAVKAALEAAIRRPA